MFPADFFRQTFPIIIRLIFFANTAKAFNQNSHQQVKNDVVSYCYYADKVDSSNIRGKIHSILHYFAPIVLSENLKDGENGL